jgi:hypothetical protein
MIVRRSTSFADNKGKLALIRNSGPNEETNSGILGKEHREMKKQRVQDLRMVGIYLILSMGAAVNAAEPNNVGDIFKEKGVDWLIGKWEAVTDANEKAIANFSLEMDGYVLSIDAKVGSQYSYRGIVFYVPSKGVLVNSGIDTKGVALSGTWGIDGDKVVLKGEQTTADGQVVRFVRYLSKTDANTMKAETYRIIDGKLSDVPGIMEFKRAIN